jgi:hypothetical protein
MRTIIAEGHRRFGHASDADPEIHAAETSAL